jgi:hypothetical protein
MAAVRPGSRLDRRWGEDKGELVFGVRESDYQNQVLMVEYVCLLGP